MPFKENEALEEYAGALDTEERIVALKEFYRNGDEDIIEERVDASSEEIDSYLDDFDDLDLIDRDSGEVQEVAEYVVDVAEECGNEEASLLFDACSDEVGRDIFDRLYEENDFSMGDVASDNGVVRATASNRYSKFEDGGFAVSSRRGRWKVYELTEMGEEAADYVDELVSAAEREERVSSLDEIAEEVGTVIIEQEKSEKKVVQGDCE